MTATTEGGDSRMWGRLRQYRRDKEEPDAHIEHMLKLGLRQYDPESNMLGVFLGELPHHRQVEVAEEALLRVWNYDDEAVPFLKVFERLFEGDKVAVRAHLINLYMRRHLYTAPEFSGSLALKGEIFKIILMGWPGEEDAEDCFRFFCDLKEPREMWKKIGDLFRDRFRRSDDRPRILDVDEAYKESRKLFEWLSRPGGVPTGIYNAINSYRLGLAGSEVAEKEAFFLSKFDISKLSRQEISDFSGLLIKTTL